MDRRKGEEALEGHNSFQSPCVTFHPWRTFLAVVLEEEDENVGAMRNNKKGWWVGWLAFLSQTFIITFRFEVFEKMDPSFKTTVRVKKDALS